MSFGVGEGLCFGSWTLDIDVVSDLSLDMGTWVVKLYYFYGLSVVPSFLLCVHSSPVTIYIFNCCVPTCTNLDCGPTCQLLRIITCCLAIFLKCATVLFKRHIIGNLCQWYGSTNFVFNSECLEVLNNCHVDILGFGLQLANSIDIVSIVTSGLCYLVLGRVSMLLYENFLSWNSIEIVVQFLLWMGDCKDIYEH